MCATDNATSASQIVTTSTVRTSCVPVTINVNDINDNAPSFTKDSYVIYVSERFPVGKEIFTFTATDADSGANGQFEYKVVTMDTSLFSLNASTGVVNVIAALDYENATSHTIIIYAEDKGSI